MADEDNAGKKAEGPSRSRDTVDDLNPALPIIRSIP